MKVALFRRFSELALERAGLKLPITKKTMLEHRLGSRVRELGLSGLPEYLELLENDHQGVELTEFLDVLSTNFTHFMRESSHFELVSRWLDERDPRPPLACWSAACATGEEPLSLAITIEEAGSGGSIEYRILATDICTEALGRARAARYSGRQLAAFPRVLRDRYFAPLPECAGEMVARARVRDSITFARLNLAKTPYPMRGPFDIIFCRNVMIYLTHQTKQGLVDELYRLLADGGLLVIGHSETLAGLCHEFYSSGPSVFHKPVAS